MKLLFFSLTQLRLYFATLIALLCHTTVSQAQITTDGTVNTQVNQNGNAAEITGGETRGGNLFHSFQDFSVNSGGEAFFNNAASINNILSRVTGGNISNIEGAIRANGSANLFLINPAGIIFGEGSSLDIGGSFYGSTASSILFENGEFSAADLDNPPLLSVNAPIGLSFRDNPGDIVLNPGTLLNVNSRETLALVGGNVSFDDATISGGSLIEPGSTMEIGGLTEAGTVNIGEDASLSFPENIARGDVTLANTSIIDAAGAGEGEIFIHARNFELTSGSSISNGVFSDSDENFRSGDVVIDATDDVSISDSVVFNNIVGNQGEAGNIEISARNITLIEGGAVNSLVSMDGDASNITLNATENISLNGSSRIESSNVFTEDLQSVVNTGEINVSATNLSINEGAEISNELVGTGNTGDINITISDTISIDSEGISLIPSRIESRINSTVGGNAGNINIQTRNLFLTNGGRIDSGVVGVGFGGDIEITAENVSVAGNQSSIVGEIFNTDTLSSNIDSVSRSGNIRIETDSLSVTENGALTTSTQGVGNAGNVIITARDSVLVDGTSESSSSTPSNISSDVISAFLNVVGGNSGNVEIDAPRLTVTNGAFISASTFSEGNAGNLTIRVSESFELSNDAVVQAEVFEGATGTGGNLTIETANLNVSNGAQLSASTRSTGDAGNLTISATDSINITGGTETGPSALLANAQIENGNGGELSISTQDLSVSDDAVISVGNFPPLEGVREPGTGEAGNLNIQANSINVESGGSITAATQSPEGEGANINLQADTINLRDDGLISAEALNEGNGGNLNIDTNFIVAFPNGNSDIIASAEQGQGGVININAESVLGIQQRPLNSSTNDINASSDVVGFDGSINIETLGINPLQGVIQIVQGIVEPDQTTAQACRANREVAAQGGLTIKGKGGVVPAPDLPLSSQNASIDGDSSTAYPQAQSVSTGYGEIVPARGVKVSEDGEVILTAYAVDNNQRGYSGSLNCGAY